MASSNDISELKETPAEAMETLLAARYAGARTPDQYSSDHERESHQDQHHHARSSDHQDQVNPHPASSSNSNNPVEKPSQSNHGDISDQLLKVQMQVTELTKTLEEERDKTKVFRDKLARKDEHIRQLNNQLKRKDVLLGLRDIGTSQSLGMSAISSISIEPVNEGTTIVAEAPRGLMEPVSRNSVFSPVVPGAFPTPH